MSQLNSFNNIMIAHNESVDYYTFNRAFSRMYDVISVATSAASAQYTPLSGIPYATELSQGFVQFTSSISGISDNNIISSSILSSYIDSISLSSKSTSTMNSSTFNVESGGGQLLNGLKFQYGYNALYPYLGGSSTPFDTYFASGNTQLYNDPSMQFTQPPFILVQLLDYEENAKYSHSYTLFNVTSSSFNYMIHSKHIVYEEVDKKIFYLTWLAIGV